MAQLRQMNIISIGELESQLGVSKWPKFISACEDGFALRIHQIAGQILADPRIRAVFVSGPTASGKTTFADRLRRLLDENDRLTRLISLDDYYNTQVGRFDEKGRPTLSAASGFIDRKSGFYCKKTKSCWSRGCMVCRT
jgi:hypothetical protein